MWSGALESPYLLLLYPITPLQFHITIILINNNFRQKSSDNMRVSLEVVLREEAAYVSQIFAKHLNSSMTHYAAILLAPKFGCVIE